MVHNIIPGLNSIITFDWLKIGYDNPIISGVAMQYYRV